MKKYFIPYLNWRVHVLTLLAMVALVLLAGDTDESCSTLYFLFIKVVGFGVAYITYRLGKYWDGKGKINELMSLADEED